MLYSKNIISLKLFFTLLFVVFNTFAINIPNKPNSRVIDQSGVLTVEQQQILSNTISNIYKTESKSEIQILIIPSLDGEPIEDVSLNIARKWGIGQRNINNGILILVATKDHKYRIEVGYGMEGVLPDGYIGNLERNIVNPNFAKNQFFEGLNLALNDIGKQVGIDYKTNSSSKAANLSSESVVIYVLVGVALFVAIAVIAIMVGNPSVFSEVLWFVLNLLTLFIFFRGGNGGNNSNNDDDIGGGGGFGGGGSSNKW